MEDNPNLNISFLFEENMANDDETKSKTEDSTATGEGKNGKSPPDEVSTVSFVAPRYEEDATLWFSQLEAKFEVSRIKAQNSKYYIAFGNLPAVLLKPVATSLPDPNTIVNAYDNLKAAILERESKSVMQRVDSVLRDIHMGDRKPSEYFAYLRETAGESFSEAAVYQIWLLRIPQAIKTTLIVLKNEPLKYRLSIADELAEANVGGGQVASVRKREDDLEDFRKELLKEVKNMCKEMLESRGRSSARGRSQTRGHSQTRGRRQERSSSRGPKKEYEFCWHHFKFGKDAYKCSAASCKFAEKGTKEGKNE